MEKTDVVKLLQEGQTVQIMPKGFSMYPLIIPGRDSAILRSIEDTEGHRGDVVLFRREDGTLVLHRIWQVSSAGYFFVGDNQLEIEGPINRRQLLGIASGFVRKGKTFSTKHPAYRIISGLWLVLRPFRYVIETPVALVRRAYGHCKKLSSEKMR
ncbi:MAG: S24/S26 family peptidase [Lachnospiraceae bacterium]|nr:S24/S26 family peptidase [Lachnospiraceae bacterium]